MLYQATRSLGVNAQVKLLCHLLFVCVTVQITSYPMNVLRYHLHLECHDLNGHEWAKCLHAVHDCVLILEAQNFVINSMVCTYPGLRLLTPAVCSTVYYQEFITIRVCNYHTISTV